jgi:hypothetical protein
MFARISIGTVVAGISLMTVGQCVAANGFYCINNAHIPMTTNFASGNSWSPDSIGVATSQSRAVADFKGAPRRDRLCLAYVDPGHTTSISFGDGHACISSFWKSPADPCQPGDTKPPKSSMRQDLE